jgi:hypothetical protein
VTGVNLPDIRRAVAARLQDVAVVAGMNIYAYPPARFTLPALLVVPDPGEYVAWHGTFSDTEALGDVRLIVRAILPASGVAQEQAQEQLDLLMGAGSVEGASVVDVLMDDKSLGGVVEDCLPLHARGYTMGELVQSDTSTPVVSCDVPLIIRVRRV